MTQFDDEVPTFEILVLVFTVCFIAMVWFGMWAGRCEARGGHLRWLSGSLTSVVCLSDDGRILEL